MKVLVVRATEDARRTAARLEAAGYEPIISPAIEIRTISAEIPPHHFDALIATSAHAFGPHDWSASLRRIPLFVVGARTAEAAQHAGFFAPDVVAPDAVALVAALDRKFPASARLLYLAGRDRKPEIERALTPRHALEVVEVYAAEPVADLTDEASAALGGGEPLSALHYSRRSAEIFLKLAGRCAPKAVIAHVRHVAISVDAAAPLQAAGLLVIVAVRPDEASMLVALAKSREPGA